MAASESKVPEDLKYTEDHEWVRLEGGNHARIGITDYAQDALTDVVYVELPDAGEEFKKGDSMGVVESTKSVSDIYAPADLKVVDVNKELDDTPELLNDDPYGKGWFVRVELANPSDADALMSAEAYRKHLESTAH